MRRSPLPVPLGRPDLRVAWSAAFLVLALSLLGFAGEPMDAAGEARWRTTRALASGHLALAEPVPGGLPLEAAGTRPGARAGTHYAAEPVAPALVAVPGEWAARLLGLGLKEEGRRQLSRTAFMVQGPLWLALTALLLVLAARRLGAERRNAWLGAMAFALCTWAGPAARTGGPEVLAGAMLLLGFHLLLALRHVLGHLSGVRRGQLLTLGAVLGLATWTHPLAWPGALVVLAATEVELRKGPRLRGGLPVPRALLLLAFGAVALAGLAVNLWRFSRALDWGLGGPRLPAGLSSLLDGLLTLLVSPGRGLFVFAPGVVLAVLGWQSSRQRGERSWSRVAALTLALTWLLGAARWPLERAAERVGAEVLSYGPPYLLVALPLVWLGVPLGLRRLGELASLRLAAFVLLGLGLFVNLPGTLVDARALRSLAYRVEAPGRSTDWDPALASPIAHWRLVRRATAGLQGPVDPVRLFGPGRGAGGERLGALGPAEQAWGSLGWVRLERERSLGWVGGLMGAILAAAGALFALLGLSGRAH